MDIQEDDVLEAAAVHSYRRAVLAIDGLPDRCVLDVAELADRIGADKLELIKWVRADIRFARLIAAKVAS